MYHVAELNIATLVAPLGDARVAEFEHALDRINALGDASPGWVWRFQTEDGDATAVRAFPDPLTIVNLTVWEDVASLKAFAYRGEHGDFFRRRRAWFDTSGPSLAIWWVRAGQLPTVEEATRRLAFLTRFGASPYAFTFASPPAPFVLDRVGLDDADAARLIARLDDELSAMYPEPGANHFTLTAHDVAPGRGAFVVARLDGRAVACGAVRLLDAATAEVKRMFVDPAHRGLKLGAAVLTELEAEARALGAKQLVLETGERQRAAVGLYESFGFAPVPCWGEYAASAVTSRCYAKLLPPD
jgi:GNAT superfamily N-acetyltransferase